MTKQVLLVEDTAFFERVIRRQLDAIDGLEVVSAANRAEAERLLERADVAPVVALLDLTLPDAPNGEIVDVALARGIPTIVFSGRFDDALRTALLEKGVVDYILKENPTSLTYVTSLVQRICANRQIDALVVDDSRIDVEAVARRLRLYQLRVHTATSCEDAMARLDGLENLRLIVLDYLMPRVDGFEFLRSLRARYSMDRVAVVGLSARAGPEVIARFLKSGANDFLPKSCTPEEFMLRISQNLDTLDRIQTLDDLANRDALTGLSNRRHLFSQGAALLARKRNAGIPVRVAAIDIDRFKSINDRYGHEAGDELIRLLGGAIGSALPEGSFAARLGGDEFCIILPGLEEQTARDTLDSLRARVRSLTALTGDLAHLDSVTLSIGLSDGSALSLQDALRAADVHLYAAKREGRDRVVAS